MTNKESYFIDGFLTKEFKAGKVLNRLNEVIRELRSSEPKPPFRWEEKYIHSVDLRPEVFTYDDVFLDILFENDIPNLLKNVTGIDLHLAHLQLRHAFKGDSYMDWHRDTHFYNGEIHGNIPPVHKIIFYPSETKAPIMRLKVSPGSHLRYLKNKFLDTFQARLSKANFIMSSDSRFVLFNTFILHAAAAEKTSEGAYRLIYSFAPDYQLGQFKDQGDLHQAWKRRRAIAG
jgi:hypothetical protein